MTAVKVEFVEEQASITDRLLFLNCKPCISCAVLGIHHLWVYHGGHHRDPSFTLHGNLWLFAAHQRQRLWCAERIQYARHDHRRVSERPDEQTFAACFDLFYARGQSCTAYEYWERCFSPFYPRRSVRTVLIFHGTCHGELGGKPSRHPDHGLGNGRAGAGHALGRRRRCFPWRLSVRPCSRVMLKCGVHPSPWP